MCITGKFNKTKQKVKKKQFTMQTQYTIHMQLTNGYHNTTKKKCNLCHHGQLNKNSIGYTIEIYAKGIPGG